ncbi:hypothetical protein J6590_067935 [Homalodisca vitripennis]|nr:hypothetical protein J6590_067935 [Homalodisca vitripennis]
MLSLLVHRLSVSSVSDSPARHFDYARLVFLQNADVYNASLSRAAMADKGATRALCSDIQLTAGPRGGEGPRGVKVSWRQPPLPLSLNTCYCLTTTNAPPSPAISGSADRSVEVMSLISRHRVFAEIPWLLGDFNAEITEVATSIDLLYFAMDFPQYQSQRLHILHFSFN